MEQDVKAGKDTMRITVRWPWVAAGVAAVVLGMKGMRKPPRWSAAFVLALIALVFGVWAIIGPGIDVELLQEQGASEDCIIIKGAASCPESTRMKIRWNLRQLDRQGQIIWSQEGEGLPLQPASLPLAFFGRFLGLSNTAYAAVIDEGEQSMLDCYLRGQNCPTTFYIRLFNDTCAETKTLSTLSGEPTTNGYAAQQLTRDTTGWPTLALSSGDYMATSAQKTFTASGGSWGPVTSAVLATTTNNSGKAINCLALSQSRTLADAENLQATLTWKQQ